MHPLDWLLIKLYLTFMLDENLLERILERLGLSEPPSPDMEGLRAVYAAWCLSVPFDNIAKLIALRTGTSGPLPGLDDAEFYNRLLDHGAAGTCWPTSNALFELLSTLGFNARRIAGSMRDTGVVSHGSVNVTIDNRDWLADSSMLTVAPLPLTQETYFADDPLFAAEVEHTGETHIVWSDLPPNPTLIPCRMLVDPATHAFYAERYEASRTRSPFNERLYAKRNFPGGKLVLIGNSRVFKTVDGMTTRELNASQLCESLRDEIGISGALVDEWKRSGALEASFNPPSGPPVATTALEPPSRRLKIAVTK